MFKRNIFTWYSIKPCIWMTRMARLWSPRTPLNDGPKRLEKSHAHVLNLFKLSVRWYFVYETFYKRLGQTNAWEERKRLLSNAATKGRIIQLIDWFCYSLKGILSGVSTPHNNVWLNIKGIILNVNCTYFKSQKKPPHLFLSLFNCKPSFGRQKKYSFILL